MTTSKRIVFFGNERLATGVSTETPTLKALIAAGYEIAAVVTQHEVGKSRKPRPSEIIELANAYNIPVLLPAKMRDIADELRAMDAVAGVLIAFGRIVPQSIIDIFPRGIINIHPSLLPLHRGPTPLESVILSGETTTGISIMALAAAMDAGPVYVQTTVTLSGTESKQTLADNLNQAGAELLLGNLPAILNGTLTATPQDDSNATYDQLIAKDAGILDWNKPATELAREVRAYSLWPKSRAQLAGRDVIVLASHVEAGSGTPGSLYVSPDAFGVFTGDGVLILDQLVPAGKQAMSGTDFMRGYQITAG